MYGINEQKSDGSLSDGSEETNDQSNNTNFGIQSDLYVQNNVMSDVAFPGDSLLEVVQARSDRDSGVDESEGGLGCWEMTRFFIQ